jgi:enediyne biosynthesis protein E4
MFRLSILALFLIGIFACKDTTKNAISGEKTLFSLLSGKETGVTFRNDLIYDKDFNIYKYRNFYNGGGVALGDLNHDGLVDIFFTSNMGSNKLYFNKGNFKFEDVSQKSGIEGKGSWSTGVAMADINADGWLDIYVCNSGNPRSDQQNGAFFRENELFINNQDGTFTEKAAEYGLNDRGLSTHAAFFDYDKDGDLDMYMLNNSFRAIGSFNLQDNLRFTRDSMGGHKLYRNDGQPKIGEDGKKTGGYKDVSVEAGILGSVIAFGLGVTVGDVNMDGWLDIYVSNDFFERDYLYINQKNGKFSEQLEQSFRHVSAASMGADMADINNDAYPEIFVTDMLPQSDHRIKTTTSFDSWDRLKYTQREGYYNQFTRNMLHLNNLDGTFSDIACLAGTEATDWSWGALMFDMDNDGWKDIFVANGIAQDLTNQDYLLFASDPTVQQEITSGGSVNFKRLIDSIPSEKVANYAFSNQRNLQFKNMAKSWGLATPSFSNGSAYGDLDNDGDLDLVVNNANMEAFIYRSEVNTLLPKNHYLKFEITGEGQNTAGLGAKIFLRHGGKTIYQEYMPMRGFESSMDPRPNIGVGEVEKIDTVLVEFLSGKSLVLTQVATNQVLKINEKEAVLPLQPKPWLNPKVAHLFQNNTATTSIPFKHEENTFTDWDRDRLLTMMYSTDGPRMAVGDVNGDQLEDFYICGAKGQKGAIMLQNAAGKFSTSSQTDFEKDKDCEDTDALFFDADGDKDLDLYVTSGGNEQEPGSPLLGDRLYINNGKGVFTKKSEALPGQKPFASACVRASDVDMDGDQDLFVGMRLIPGKVGVPVGGFLMLNDGKANFSPSPQMALQNLGLLTDAVWTDLDGDEDEDLLVVGEWMPIKIFKNNAGKLEDMTKNAGLNGTNGLWKRIEMGDFNKDGKPDFIVGNHGLNSRLKPTADEPISMFFNDFDKNGTTEQFLCRYNEGKQLPFTLRGELVSNIPVLKKKYLKYGRYAGQTMNDIFTKEQMKDAIELKATMLSSAVLMNTGNFTFTLQALPNEAQLSPMFGVCVDDFDGDGNLDALTGGNFWGVKPEFGQYDADYGTFLKGDGKGGFAAVRSNQSGFNVDGQVRDIKKVKGKRKNAYIVARNNATPMVFGFR